MGREREQLADRFGFTLSDCDRAELEVLLNVFDVAVASALIAAIDGAAFVVLAEPAASTVLVTDDFVRDVRLPRLATIEVVAPRPDCAANALDNVLGGVTHGIVLSDDPDALASALLARRSGGVVFSIRVVALARQAHRSQRAGLRHLNRYLC